MDAWFRLSRPARIFVLMGAAYAVYLGRESAGQAAGAMFVVLLVLGILSLAKGASQAVDTATGKTWANERLAKKIDEAQRKR